MKFIKSPLPVTVSFAKSAGELHTLEGPVRYALGDAIMTGINGEHWPISRANFEATYVPVGPLALGEAGQYVKKLIPVDAYQIDRDGTITLEGQHGDLQAQAGDWVITGPDGSQWVVAQAIFQATYQAVSDR